MKDENSQSNARYSIVHGNECFGNGDICISGTKCRQLMIMSNEFMPFHGVFQVYCVEGVSKGIVEGYLKIPLPYTLLFDEDFADFASARDKFRELIDQTEKEGFRCFTLMDEISRLANLTAARSKINQG